MSSENDILTILERVGAILTDSHIVYTSGRHGRSYINKDALYPHTAETSFLCSCIAARFLDERVEAVAGPTIGGVILAQWVAHHLSTMTGTPVLAVYAEEEGEGNNQRRTFRRGYDALLAGKRVLVVEDILNTGGSARGVVEAVRALGGDVVGLGALCNRGDVTAVRLGVPRLAALVDISMGSWEATECPLCQQGIPINTRVGKGAAFLAQQKDTPR
jgi:orotate phosphoribosyltransferase